MRLLVQRPPRLGRACVCWTPVGEAEPSDRCRAQRPLLVQTILHQNSIKDNPTGRALSCRSLGVALAFPDYAEKIFAITGATAVAAVCYLIPVALHLMLRRQACEQVGYACCMEGRLAVAAVVAFAASPSKSCGPEDGRLGH